MLKGRRGFLKRFTGISSFSDLYDKLSFAVENNQWEKELYKWNDVSQPFKRIVIYLCQTSDININSTPINTIYSQPPLPVPLQYPPQVEHFTGRTEQLSSIINDLQPNKVITLYGAEGIGKTALAAELVNQLVIDEAQAPEHFPDGIIFYSFDNNSSIESVLLHIANTYHAKEQGESVQQVAQKALDTKTALLVLDGVENIDSNDLQSILEIKGNCSVLITTRDTPQVGANQQEIQPLNIEDVVSLLNKWTVDQLDNQKIAIQICEELGRLPLAIKLAGYYLNQTNDSASDYLQQLKEHPQPQSIRGFLTRTVAQLTDTEQKMLSVFGCLAMKPVPLVVLEEVLELSAEQSKKAIQSLINFGLIEVNTDQYEFNHALIHTYTHEQIALSEPLFTRLLNWYKKFAEEETEKGQQGHSVLDMQQAHLLYLIEQAHQRQQWQAVIDLMWVVDDYLDICAYWQERKHLLNLALTATQAAKKRDTEGKVLGNLGLTYSHLDETEKAIDYHQQALVISQEINNRKWEGVDLSNLGDAYADLGEVEKAINYHQQALIISQEIGDRQGEIQDLGSLGGAYTKLGKVEKTVDYYQQALTISREIGDRQEEGKYLCNLGCAYKSLGQIETAIDFFKQALAISQEIGNRQEEAHYLFNLGVAYKKLDKTEQTIDYYHQALAISQEIGDRQKEKFHLDNLGEIYYQLGQVKKAINYYQQALVINQEIGDREGESQELCNLGSAYKKLGQVEKAIDYHQQALVISQEAGDQEGEVRDLCSVGDAYIVLNETTRAFNYYQQALVITQEIEGQLLEGIILSNLGNTYYQLGELEKAIDYHQKALIISQETGDREEEGIRLNNLGVVYQQLNQVEIARDYYQQALVIAEEVHSPNVEILRGNLNRLDSFKNTIRSRIHHSSFIYKI